MKTSNKDNPSIPTHYLGEMLRLILKENSFQLLQWAQTQQFLLPHFVAHIERESALLKQNNKEEKEILPFTTQYQPSVSTLKEVSTKKWSLIQNQPLPRQSFKEPPIISYKKGKSLKDMLVRAKI